jgi:prepilin-type processing-associated H-X9-DG protein
MVLLFETDFGKTKGGRTGLLKDRAYHQTLPSNDPNKKVYKNRWNQAGGLEIVDTRHHKGFVNVAFVDTSVRLIKKADLPSLRWTADVNDN